MIITWSIKRKTATGWEHPPLAELQEKRLLDILRAESGTESVAEFIMDGDTNYFCGTEVLRKRMLKKGKAITYDRAIQILHETNPALLEQICPDYHQAAEVFPCAQAAQQELRLNE